MYIRTLDLMFLHDDFLSSYFCAKQLDNGNDFFHLQFIKKLFLPDFIGFAPRTIPKNVQMHGSLGFAAFIDFAFQSSPPFH